MTNNNDPLLIDLSLVQHPVDPVQMTPRVVEVEQKEKVQVVANVGVYGNQTKARANQRCIITTYKLENCNVLYLN